jgi:hypothetical protein
MQKALTGVMRRVTTRVAKWRFVFRKHTEFELRKWRKLWKAMGFLCNNLERFGLRKGLTCAYDPAYFGRH